MKKVLISIVSILVILSIVPASFAGAGFANTPTWLPCNSTTNYLMVQSTAFAPSGYSHVAITYAAPLYDWDYFLVCAKENFYSISFEAFVYNSLNQLKASGGITTSGVGGSVSLPLYQNICSCNPVPYYLKMGDRISLTITVRYDFGIFYHTGGYGFYV